VIDGPVVIGRNGEVKSGRRIERVIVTADHQVFEAQCDVPETLVTNENLIDFDGLVACWTNQYHLGVRGSCVPSAAWLTIYPSVSSWPRFDR
jgi:hypothetical protein